MLFERVGIKEGKGFVMEVKATILCDNLAGPVSFKGEHGLAVLLEVDGKSFLWDCGQSDVVVHNARLLGLDLRGVEGIGISHGHFDHAGGLLEVLAASGPKKIYMHPEALEPKFLAFGEVRRFIGIPFRSEALELPGGGLELNRGPVEVMPGVKLTGEVPRVSEFEGYEANLYRLTDGELEPDPFTDDQALVVDTPDGAVVLTGCAHSGLVNILKHIMETHGKIRAVVGGTHLGLGATPERVSASLDFLEEILPEKIVPCHCTGLPVIARILDRFKDRAAAGQVGMSFTFS